MNRLSSVVLVAVPLLFLANACIFEDQSDCPPTLNVDLTFSYHGDTNDPSMFMRKIDRISLFAFSSEDGTLSYSGTLDRQALEKRQGTSLFLPEGKYRVYTWGNVAGNSAITGMDGLASWGIAAPAFFEGSRITTNDHLYQGGIEIDVPALSSLPENSNNAVHYDIKQCGAHINFEIFVKGTGEKDFQNTFPVVKIGKMMPEYGVDLKRMAGFDSDYFPVVSWDDEHKCARAVFQTLRFEDDNDIVVSVLESSANPVEKAGKALKDFLAENSIQVSGINEVTVSILFEFSNLGLKITIPEWTKQDISPDLP